METGIVYDPIKVVLAVNEPGDTLIVGYHTTHPYDHWFDEGTPYATDNGFHEEELPKEPGLYNCTAQPRWQGDEEEGELFFDITSIERVARFTKGEAVRVFQVEQAIPVPMPQEMIDQLQELADEENECTCLKGDNFCPVHNADYARYIRS